MLKSAQNILQKISPYVFFPLAFYWIIFTFVEYISIHTSLSTSFINFEYARLLIVLLLITVIFFYLSSNKTKWGKYAFLNFKSKGIWILLLVFVSSIIMFSFFGFKTEVLSTSNYLPSILYLSWQLIYTTLGVSLVGLSAYAYGKLIEKLFKFKNENPEKILLQIGFGFFLISLLLFALAAFGILNIFSVSTILAIPILIEIKNIFVFIKNLLWQDFEIEEIKPRHILISLIGLTSASLTLLHTQKPFPLGWDSSTLYLNLSNILAQRGELLSGYDPYNWSLLTSIGYVFNNPNIAIGITALGGMFALIALYHLCRKFMSSENSILVVTIVGTLPSLVFQSTRDIKTDLPLIFVALLVINLVLNMFKSNRFENLQSNWKYFLIIGILAGFSIGIKLTALFFVFGLFSVLIFRYFKQFGVISFTGMLTFLLIQFNLHELFGPTLNQGSEIVLTYGGLLISIISILLIIFYKQFELVNLKRLIFVSLIVGIGIFIGSGHWFIWNISTVENLNSVQQIIKGRNSSPPFNLSKINNQFKLETEQNIETITKTEQKSNISGDIEAVSRYAGYEDDGLRYQTLFYDTILNTNVKNPMTVIGFLLITVLPIYFSYSLYKRNKLYGVGLLLFLLVFVLIPGYILSAQSPGCLGNMTFDCLSNGLTNKFGEITGIEKLSIFPIHYISLLFINIILVLNSLGVFTLVASLIFISLIIYFGFKMAGYSSNLKIVGIFTTTYLFFWLILGQGIYWYGLLGFILLFFLIGAYKQIFDEDDNNIFFIKTVNFFIIIWLFFAYFNLYTPRNPGTETMFTSAIAGYMIGENSKVDTLQEINSAYVIATNEINQNSDFIYRVGTQIVYFVDDNDKRILNDGQLDFFNKIYDSSSSKEQIAEKMELAGFKYLVVDLNTASIDTTPGQTLTNKFNKLDDFIQDNERLSLISTDRIVKIEGNNQKKYKGDEIVRNGSIAVFKID